MSVRKRTNNEGGQALKETQAPETDKKKVERGGTSSIPVSTFNLAKNIAGSGVLTLSKGMSVGVGYVPAAGIVYLTCFMSAYTFSLIGRACERTGELTFRGLWSGCVGSGSAWVVDLSCFLMTLGTVIIYPCFLGDLFPPLLEQLGVGGAALDRTNVILGVTVVVLLPLSSFRKLSFLSYTSFVGMGGIVYCMVFLGIRWHDGSYAEGGAFFSATPVEMRPAFERSSIWGLSPMALVLTSNLGVAWMAHYNAPKMYGELVQRSSARFNSVVKMAFGALTVLFVGIMWLGYCTFGDNSDSMILNNYATGDPLAFAARFGIGFAILFGYPLPFTGLRDATLGMLGIGAESALFPLVTVSLVASCTALSLLASDIGLVIGVAGSICGGTLIYIFPSIIFLRTFGLEVSGVERAICYFLILFGTVLALVGSTIVVISSLHPQLLE